MDDEDQAETLELESNKSTEFSVMRNKSHSTSHTKFGYPVYFASEGYHITDKVNNDYIGIEMHSNRPMVEQIDYFKDQNKRRISLRASLESQKKNKTILDNAFRKDLKSRLNHKLAEVQSKSFEMVESGTRRTSVKSSPKKYPS